MVKYAVLWDILTHLLTLSCELQASYYILIFHVNTNKIPEWAFESSHMKLQFSPSSTFGKWTKIVWYFIGVYLQVKIEFRLKIFNLGWFSISFVL